MSSPHNQLRESPRTSDLIIKPTAELSGAALDEALQKARQIVMERAKRKYIEDAAAGRNPVWDPSWDKPHGNYGGYEDNRTKRPKVPMLKTFKSTKYYDYLNFIHDLQDRFALYNIRSLEDKIRMASSYLDRDLRYNWRTHLEDAYGGRLESVPDFETFTSWLSGFVATPIERRIKGAHALADIKQEQAESYESFSDRFDNIIVELPEKPPEVMLVTIKLMKMRGDLREQIKKLGDPFTLLELRTLARRAEFLIQPVNITIAQSFPPASQSARAAPQLESSHANLAHSPRPCFTGLQSDVQKLKCWNCRNHGHYATECPSEKRNRWQETQADPQSDLNKNALATLDDEARVAARKERKQEHEDTSHPFSRP